MTENHLTDISPLRLKDAPALAPLLAAYTQSLKRGAPRRPDIYYAETLLQDRVVEVMGAWVDNELVGFAIYYDLPDPVTGLRYALLEHAYVHHDHRGKGIARALIDVIADQAEERGWGRMVSWKAANCMNSLPLRQTGTAMFSASMSVEIVKPAIFNRFNAA
jgi:GNAT superfamily N-acetyltransferase